MASDGEIRLRDTLADFEEFAKSAFLEPPVLRRDQWRKRYESPNADVFEALTAECGELAVPAVVRNLSHVRGLATEARKVMPDLIAEVEPGVRTVLEAPGEPRPLHVLMVGTFAANALATRLGDEVAVLHCVEWFSEVDPARVLIAHEDTHAWHELISGHGFTGDLAWRAFTEGLAVQVSRLVVPNRPEEEYFWYGVEGFEDWLPWCVANRDGLFERFAEALDVDDTDEAVESFFGAGFVDGRWRTGMFIADDVVGRLDASPQELARLDRPQAVAAFREALGG